MPFSLLFRGKQEGAGRSGWRRNVGGRRDIISGLMTFIPAKWPRRLRSSEWFGGTSRDHIYHRSWMKNQGLPADLFDGRPVIGICNTWSELTPCNAHLRDLAQRVKHGIYEAGGLPLEFPVFSTGESALRPTAMMYRNLASMDVEEALRANPLDGVVLMVGCDKTTPALLMGAASVDIPAIVVTGGPMLNGWFRNERVGSGTALWQMSEAVKAGSMSGEDFLEAEQAMSRSPGSCNTMGTASTMASMAEALGMALSGNAAIPAVDSRRRVMAQLTGRRIVQMVKDDLKPSDVLTREAFENAIRCNGAIGGSTNAVLHLLALAGRVGVELTLDDWDRLGRDVPTIVNLMPSGKYLMEEFFYAGGLPVVLRMLGEGDMLHKNALTVSGQTQWEQVKSAQNWNEDVIRPVKNALTGQGGIAVLRGNLAPDGAVLKPSAATPTLMVHRGRAVVFEDIDDYKAKINDPALDIDETCVMVLKNCGPKGYPGMAEVGNMGLPPKVLKRGVTDMVRISDARMSGTAYGTVILHASPEAAAGGPLAIVRDGDYIELDVPNRRLHLDVSQAEIKRRLAAWTSPVTPPAGGYAKLYHEHVTGADTGADFDFLKGCRGHAVPRDSH
jgi:dihydroxy-acid dehydratase